MPRLLVVKGSPRRDKSQSAQVANAFLAAYRGHHADAEVDEIDLWQADLPEFDGDRAAAKMSFFGDAAMNELQQSAWDEIVAITARFTSADDYLFTVPMWNGGIPYRVKLYIDIMTQPGLLFSFDPAKGCSGLLQGKRATTIYSSGVYQPGVPQAFGSDFHSTYFDDWLRFIGIANRASVRLQPTVLTTDPASVMAAALQDARRQALR